MFVITEYTNNFDYNMPKPKSSSCSNDSAVPHFSALELPSLKLSACSRALLLANLTFIWRPFRLPQECALDTIVCTHVCVWQFRLPWSVFGTVERRDLLMRSATLGATFLLLLPDRAGWEVFCEWCDKAPLAVGPQLPPVIVRKCEVTKRNK
jgi:hypothetical protein